jgi:formylglycine-generating enzyme required for sulfatase activity
VGDGLPYDGDLNSKPLHKVTLDGFSLGKYPVTYAEFDLFAAAQRLPRINQAWMSEKYRKPNNPAGTTWEGAKAYCRWLGMLSGLPFDLPTEAQWEYAVRSGMSIRPITENWKKDGISPLTSKGKPRAVLSVSAASRPIPPGFTT